MCGGVLPEKRVYKRSEIREICKDMKNFSACRDDIMLAMKENRIQED